jgi:hypothetical protein
MKTSRAATREPRRRLIARGRTINLLLFLAIVAGAYVGYVTLQPWVQGYELKAIQKVVCTQYMRETIFRSRRAEWQKTWVHRMNRIGLNLQEHQYQFNLSDPCTRKRCSCQAEAVFEGSSNWIILEDFTDIEPFRQVRRVKVDTPYRANY